ncbi:MAG: hypothetical protein WC015_11010, partial [Methanoregula sp.]
INDAIEKSSNSAHECFEKLRRDLLLLNFRQNDQNTKNFVASYEEKMKECLPKETQEQRSSDNTLILLQRLSPTISAFNEMSADAFNLKLTPDAAAKKDELTADKRESLRVKVSKSQITLYLFDKFHSIIIPTVILSVIGFSQIYQSNATFGVNWIGDYSTLILWGFGTGPASDTIVKLVKDNTK